MFGVSYGQILLILGAAAAVIGPKDLPIIARTVGRLAGRAIGYAQIARGQFNSVMQQSQAQQVHKELQDAMAQLEAIRHEIRTVSFMNPGSMTTRLVDKIASEPFDVNVKKDSSESHKESSLNPREDTPSVPKDHIQATPSCSDMHAEATAYARLAESMPFNSNSMDEVIKELKDGSGQFVILPISAETAKLLPNRKGSLTGSDILLEAILEEGVAHDAQGFLYNAQSHTEKG